MFTDVYMCLQMFTDVYRCLQMFENVYRCLQMFKNVYRCLHMFTNVYRCLQMFTDVYRCLQMFTDVYRCLPTDKIKHFSFIWMSIFTSNLISIRCTECCSEHQKLIPCLYASLIPSRYSPKLSKLCFQPHLLCTPDYTLII